MSFGHIVILGLTMLGVPYNASLAEHVDSLSSWTIGVRCEFSATGLRRFYGYSADEARTAIAEICDDIVGYLQKPEDPNSTNLSFLFSLWVYRSNAIGTAGTMQFRIKDGYASGECNRLVLQFKGTDSIQTLFDVPLYPPGDIRCYSYPARADFRRDFGNGFLDEIQEREASILEFFQERVPLVATEGLGYIHLPPTVERPSFFCCQLEWERYRRLRASLFSLSTNLDDQLTAQGTRQPAHERECSAKPLALAVCEAPATIDEILKRSELQTVRTEILLRSYIDPEPKVFKACAKERAAN